jgi:hypothetical protein
MLGLLQQFGAVPAPYKRALESPEPALTHAHLSKVSLPIRHSGKTVSVARQQYQAAALRIGR